MKRKVGEDARDKKRAVELNVGGKKSKHKLRSINTTRRASHLLEHTNRDTISR